jgi:hypothetical protein
VPRQRPPERQVGHVLAERVGAQRHPPGGWKIATRPLRASGGCLAVPLAPSNRSPSAGRRQPAAANGLPTWNAYSAKLLRQTKLGRDS